MLAELPEVAINVALEGFRVVIEAGIPENEFSAFNPGFGWVHGTCGRRAFEEILLACEWNEHGDLGPLHGKLLAPIEKCSGQHRRLALINGDALLVQDGSLEPVASSKYSTHLSDDVVRSRSVAMPSIASQSRAF